MMWSKVAVVVAAVMVQLSGNMSHIFYFNILCRKQAKYKVFLIKTTQYGYEIVILITFC